MRLGKRVMDEAKAIDKNLYHLNAPNSIGYLFRVNEKHTEIVKWVCCDRIAEIFEFDAADGVIYFEWDYFYSFKWRKIFKINSNLMGRMMAPRSKKYLTMTPIPKSEG